MYFSLLIIIKNNLYVTFQGTVNWTPLLKLPFHEPEKHSSLKTQDFSIVAQPHQVTPSLVGPTNILCD